MSLNTYVHRYWYHIAEQAQIKHELDKIVENFFILQLLKNEELELFQLVCFKKFLLKRRKKNKH